MLSAENLPFKDTGFPIKILSLFIFQFYWYWSFYCHRINHSYFPFFFLLITNMYLWEILYVSWGYTVDIHVGFRPPSIRIANVFISDRETKKNDHLRLHSLNVKLFIKLHKQCFGKAVLYCTVLQLSTLCISFLVIQNRRQQLYIQMT